MKNNYSVMGGFVVKELPAEKKVKDEIAKCWDCGTYGRQSEMTVKNSRYFCKYCK